MPSHGMSLCVEEKERKTQAYKRGVERLEAAPVFRKPAMHLLHTAFPLPGSGASRSQRSRHPAPEQTTGAIKRTFEAIYAIKVIISLLVDIPSLTFSQDILQVAALHPPFSLNRSLLNKTATCRHQQPLQPRTATV